MTELTEDETHALYDAALDAEEDGFMERASLLRGIANEHGADV